MVLSLLCFVIVCSFPSLSLVLLKTYFVFWIPSCCPNRNDELPQLCGTVWPDVHENIEGKQITEVI